MPQMLRIVARLGAAVRAPSLLMLAVVLPHALHAQQSRPPLRRLGAAVATSDALGALSGVRHLPDGKVLVNDPAKRQVLLLDSTLKTIAVVADTTSATKNAYGTRVGGLLAFRGDSTLFVDPASLSMLVIDPAGKLARVMAAPRPNDVMFLLGGPLGNPGFDARGRMVYRTMGFPGERRVTAAQGQPMAPPVFPDSGPIVRFDLFTRKLDTAAFVKLSPPRLNRVEHEGRVTISSITNPLPEVDDWAVLPDGTIAIVRKDYRVDFISPDGERTSGPKIPFDWQRLTDSAKVAVIDSARTAMERFRASLASGAPPRGDLAAPGGGGMGAQPMIMIREQGGTPPVRGGPGGPAGGPSVNIVGGGPAGPMPPLTFVSPSELPDYKPAFVNGSVRADADGKLWVRIVPTKPSGAGPEYDVIDRSGKLVDRVAVPAGSVIVGFGPGGVVYLGVRDAAGTHLVRARER